METMLDRAAAAVLAELQKPEAVEDDAVLARQLARAALEAMREPTEAMLEALQENEPTPFEQSGGDQAAYVAMWRSAIDAALSSETPA
jgi:hypothetical protein